jgi:hypothetical protein
MRVWSFNDQISLTGEFELWIRPLTLSSAYEKASQSLLK